MAIKRGEMHLEMPRFASMVPPNGFLPDQPAAHACFYYYLLAQKLVEEDQDITPVLEEIPYNYQTPGVFERLHETSCFLYNVEPGEMNQHWDNVDMQARKLGLPELPARYKFAAVPKIIT